MPGSMSGLSKAARRPSKLAFRDLWQLVQRWPIGLTGNPVVNGDANPGRGHRTTLDGGAVVTGNKSPRLRPLNLPGVDTTEISASNTNGALPPIQKGNSLVSPMDSNRIALVVRVAAGCKRLLAGWIRFGQSFYAPHAADDHLRMILSTCGHGRVLTTSSFVKPARRAWRMP